MANRTQILWAVTVPDYQRGNTVGRWAYYGTVSYLKRDAIKKFKALYPHENGEELWAQYRKEQGARVERIEIRVVGDND